jgi:hypothetical protein
MGKTNNKAKIAKRFSQTPRGMRQKFTGRKNCVWRKLFELGLEPDVQCWGMIKRRAQFYTFNSNKDGRHPPKWKDLVR